MIEWVTNLHTKQNAFACLLKGEKKIWGSNYLRMWCLISWHFFHFICLYGFVEDVWCLSVGLHDFSFLAQHPLIVYSYHDITKYTYRLHDVNPTYTMLQRAQKKICLFVLNTCCHYTLNTWMTFKAAVYFSAI